jgi:starvation-inducible DNA-binding protein
MSPQRKSRAPDPGCRLESRSTSRFKPLQKNSCFVQDFTCAPFHTSVAGFRTFGRTYRHLKGTAMKDAQTAAAHRAAPLKTPTSLGEDATRDIAAALTTLLADVFALYLKTKNFHWHMSGPYFRDYHLLLDDQSNQIYATTDPIAERARKIGGKTLRSAGQITKLQRIADNDAEFVTPSDMLAELREDNLALAGYMRETHALCDEYGDVATASLLENWIDEAEQRVWFLFESGRHS